MYSQESFQQYDDFERQQHQQSMALLKNLDLKKQVNRQWLAKSYRKLNSLLQNSLQTKFNLAQQSSQLPNKVTQYAFSIKPYQFSQGLQTFSKQFCESNAGKRKCQMPIVMKSGTGIWQNIRLDDHGVGYIRQNNRFNIKIEAEENSTIIVTHQNNHPLRVKSECRQYFRQTALIQITPPTILCIVVTKQQQYIIDIPPNQTKYRTVPFKLPSSLIKLQIKKTSQGQGPTNFMRGLNDAFMIRPQQTFDHGLSNSQGSNWHPFIPIETESRSRD